MTVLILDDQPHVIAGLMLGVRWETCGVKRILKATSALEAREKLQAEHVDVLLADIEMPGETGLELIQWMRQEGYTTECIFLTAHAEFDYVQHALRLDVSSGDKMQKKGGEKMHEKGGEKCMTNCYTPSLEEGVCRRIGRRTLDANQKRAQERYQLC